MKTRLALLLLFPLLMVGLLYTALRYLTCIIGNPAKAWHVALMIDETCNVDVNGRVNETISARAAKAQKRGSKWGCLLCGLLNWIQQNHCQKALQDDTTPDSSIPPSR